MQRSDGSLATIPWPLYGSFLYVRETCEDCCCNKKAACFLRTKNRLLMNRWLITGQLR